MAAKEKVFATHHRVEVVDKASPDFGRVGEVVSCDEVAHTCMVLLDGDKDAKQFSCAQLDSHPH